MTVNTLGASRAWSVDAELTAMRLLRGLVTPAAYDYYLLTGSFLETSKRSRVTYLFRRLRPTLALREQHDGSSAPIAALCMHPIGYYKDSFAGCMVPTDDVVAHLLMMRGDERKFWAKANHHDLNSPESGL